MHVCVRLSGQEGVLRWGGDTLNLCVFGSHCHNVTFLMHWCPHTLVTPRAEDTRWEKQGLRSSRGHWRPRQRPRMDEPASSTGSWMYSETRHFRGHVRSAWAWPCAARTKAHAGQGIMCRSVPCTGDQLRYLGGRLPALFAIPFHVFNYFFLIWKFLLRSNLSKRSKKH